MIGPRVPVVENMVARARGKTCKRSGGPPFDVPIKHHDALGNYMRHVKRKSETLNEVFNSHMELYWSGIDALTMEDVEMKRKALSNGCRDPYDRQFRIMAHLLRFLARTESGRGGSKFSPQRSVVPTGVESFLERYVHDVFEHFSLSGLRR